MICLCWVPIVSVQTSTSGCWLNHRMWWWFHFWSLIVLFTFLISLVLFPLVLIIVDVMICCCLLLFYGGNICAWVLVLLLVGHLPHVYLTAIMVCIFYRFLIIMVDITVLFHNFIGVRRGYCEFVWSLLLLLMCAGVIG